ncbi:MAG TPA: tetratricopeptide repeat protein [Verrucomicrobiae bacterium]|nr:tetratricopeptide repeat protein [Verrucomicrobiae bacterium]
MEVRSPNFVIVSNASEKDARKFDVQFEQIRDVFRESLAVANMHPSQVITVLAVKNEDSMRELLPEYWAKGRSHPAGIFVPSRMNMPFAAVQMNVPGDNPYHGVYHEYYHSLTVPYLPDLPLWLSEGLAEFFGNTTIEGDKTILGRPDPDWIAWLKQNQMLPLNVLFNVGYKSPYYSEEGKVSTFYAESWALTHYLWIGEKESHRAMLSTYLDAISNGATQEEAAAKAFGDLKRMQETLDRYISSASFTALEFKSPPRIPDSEITERTLSDAESQAYRAGFGVARGKWTDAKPMLEEAIKSDPNLALAHQYLGIADFYGGQLDDARSELSRAISLDPQNATTRFVRALIVFHGGDPSAPEVEQDLRAAIAANPTFPDPYALLGVVLAVKGENLDEALAMAQKAVSFEPGSAEFQLDLAQVLGRMGKYDDAHMAGLRAMEWTKDPEQRAEALAFLNHLNSVRLYGENFSPSAAPTVDVTPKGKMILVAGTVSNLNCKGGMEFDLTNTAGKVHLRLAPGVAFTIAVPGGPINPENPCKLLDGKLIKAGYLADSNNDQSGTIETLELLQPQHPQEDVMRGHAPQGAVVATVEGTASSVSCKGNELFLEMSVKAASLSLHAKDFTRVVFDADSPQARGEFSPCTDLKGLPLRIGYIPGREDNSAGEIQTIVIEK